MTNWAKKIRRTNSFKEQHGSPAEEKQMIRDGTLAVMALMRRARPEFRFVYK